MVKSCRERQDYIIVQCVCNFSLIDLILFGRWVMDFKLDTLKFARLKTAYSYFAVTSILSSPELSDARISWAKSVILVTVIDDFFDIVGSMEELVNLVQIVDKYNIPSYLTDGFI